MMFSPPAWSHALGVGFVISPGSGPSFSPARPEARESPCPMVMAPVAPAVPPAPVTFVATMVQGFPGQDPGAPTLGPLRHKGAGPTE
ncbi:MAG: hypothetical protein EBU14_09195 [Acetobacteraceae bacterium]|jgi:hypothetical protein|nr:hypothetical protein [Acetobacteraceae bacterium]